MLQCVVFFVLFRAVSVLFLYFVVGVVFMKFVKKKEGAEIVPNIIFWKSLPVLVKVL
jgi:hypothetical protein